MFKLFWFILIDEKGGLGVTRASLTSSICERTGDESLDAAVKVNRLINEQGPLFCQLTNWPFLRNDISFSITSSAYKYSGASYLPTTYKKVVAGFLLDGSDRYPLHEVSIGESYEWGNPDENSGRPDEFCITRIESGYWEIQFNRKPDSTYTIYLEIELQWTDLTGSTSETVITKEYYPAFTHFVSMARFIQQGDTANYMIANNQWFNPLMPKGTILGTILANLSSPLRKKSVKMDAGYMKPLSPSSGDYKDGA
jgi:hypothetical protein